jgi:hypothetical protein
MQVPHGATEAMFKEIAETFCNVPREVRDLQS